MVMSDSELLLGLWAREGRGREEASPAGQQLNSQPKGWDWPLAWGLDSIPRSLGRRGGAGLQTHPSGTSSRAPTCTIPILRVTLGQVLAKCSGCSEGWTAGCAVSTPRPLWTPPTPEPGAPTPTPTPTQAPGTSERGFGVTPGRPCGPTPRDPRAGRWQFQRPWGPRAAWPGPGRPSVQTPSLRGGGVVRSGRGAAPRWGWERGRGRGVKPRRGGGRGR